jgi:hypothetical protein
MQNAKRTDDCKGRHCPGQPYHAVMTPLRAPDTPVIGGLSVYGGWRMFVRLRLGLAQNHLATVLIPHDRLPEAMRNLGKVFRRTRETPDISAESS